MNTSATKFSSLFSLDFDHAGQIAAANVQVPEILCVHRASVQTMADEWLCFLH